MNRSLSLLLLFSSGRKKKKKKTRTGPNKDGWMSATENAHKNHTVIIILNYFIEVIYILSQW